MFSNMHLTRLKSASDIVNTSIQGLFTRSKVKLKDAHRVRYTAMQAKLGRLNRRTIVCAVTFNYIMVYNSVINVYFFPFKMCVNSGTIT